MDISRMFLESLRRGRVTHAYLLTGAGAQELCSRAAALLLCEGGDKPCGRCKACLEHKAGANPDLLFVRPTESKKIISVESVRAMEQELAKSRLHSAYRPVIINEAHKMNEKAQSALLKTLEEPPEFTVFLLCGNENGLLPTILSRCVTLRLKGAEAEPEPEQGEKLLSAAERGRVPREMFPKERSELNELFGSVCSACHGRMKSGGDMAPFIKVVELMDTAEYRLESNANANLLVDWLTARLYRIFAKSGKA